MKTFVKVMAVTLVVIMLVSVLGACANKLSGTYESNLGTSLTFKGDKITYKLGAFEVEGTYEIDGDEIKLSLPNTPINGTFNFEKDGDTITIGVFSFTKK